MFIRSLELKNFRGFHAARIDFDKQLTVLVGKNGAGKSSVLDALSILLDQYSSKILGQKGTARRLSENDTRQNSPETYIRLTVDDQDREVRWALRKQGNKQKLLRPSGSDLSGLNDYIRLIADRGTGQDGHFDVATLPIYYDQRRALAEVPQRKRATAKHTAKDAFEESRGKNGLDLRNFVYWFEEREVEELRRQRRDKNYLDPQLENVRHSIQTATGLTDLSYRSVPPRGLLVNKQGVEVRVDQLSTGERLLLAMAGDLARRLAMRSVEDQIGGQKRAVVLIDEIELHLHPEWQRRILPWLLKGFPQCQFIVSTHSPQVIGAIEAKHIRILEFEKDGNTFQTVLATKGRDTNYLLLSVFDSDERSADTKKMLLKFERALRDNKLDLARQELVRLQEQIEGSAPELSIAQARLQRREAVAS